MTDAELVARLRGLDALETSFGAMQDFYCGDEMIVAADRIEALVKERDRLDAGWHEANVTALAHAARAEQLEAALESIAEEAAVPVYTWKNGINFKKMYEGWRKIAVKRIDIARATLAEIKGESHE